MKSPLLNICLALALACGISFGVHPAGLSSDGPGSGGGYSPVLADDGPGAGGGYGTLASDGPGAGGGYRTNLLANGDSPGAGGGYRL